MPASGSGYAASNYVADQSIFNTRFRRFWIGVMCLAILVFPFVTSSYNVHLVNLVALACIGALALNLLMGCAGLISLGQAAFLCTGGFVTVFFSLEVGLPFWLVVPIAGVFGAVFGLIAGLPSLRLHGLYLALSTLAMHFIIIYLASVYQYSYWERRAEGFVGGVSGFDIPYPSFGPLVLNTTREWYFFLVVVVTIVAMLSINLMRSRIGRAWMAIRDADIAASASGVNVAYYKLLAFTFTSAIVAMQGSLSAYYMNYVSGEEYTLWLGFLYVVMIMVGGMGSILGSFLGAFFVVLLPYGLAASVDLLGITGGIKAHLYAIQYAFYGFLLVLFLLLESRGLVGIWLRIRTFFEFWPFKHLRAISTAR